MSHFFLGNQKNFKKFARKNVFALYLYREGHEAFYTHFPFHHPPAGAAVHRPVREGSA